MKKLLILLAILASCEKPPPGTPAEIDTVLNVGYFAVTPYVDSVANQPGIDGK